MVIYRNRQTNVNYLFSFLFINANHFIVYCIYAQIVYFITILFYCIFYLISFYSVFYCFIYPLSQHLFPLMLYFYFTLHGVSENKNIFSWGVIQYFDFDSDELSQQLHFPVTLGHQHLYELYISIGRSNADKRVMILLLGALDLPVDVRNLDFL